MYVNLQIRYHDKQSTYSKEAILEQNSFLFFLEILILFWKLLYEVKKKNLLSHNIFH